MAKKEVRYYEFERVISGAEYGIPVDLKLTFITVSEVGTDGAVITPHGALNDERAALIVDIEGDIMPEGFEHGVHFDAENCVPTPHYMAVLKTIAEVEQKIGQTYFEPNKSWKSDNMPFTPTRAFSLVIRNNIVTSEFAQLKITFTGSPNGHPHWMGNHLS